MLIKRCLICGKKIKTYPSINAKTCSRKCGGIRHKKQMLGQPSAMKGKKHSPQTIAKFKQVRNTEEWKNKIFTDERNKKISTTRKLKYGTKNKNRKYLKNLIRKSAEYRKWRNEVFRRDDYTCQLCKKRSRAGISVYLEADHILSFESYPELRFIVSNGRTLCKDCHKKTHNFGIKIWQKSHV